MNHSRYLAFSGLAGFLLAAAGCQSGDGLKALDLRGPKEPAEPRVTQSELRAYCPPITLREGTAYFTTYRKGAKRPSEAEEIAAQGAPGADVIYQAAITDNTRSCTSADGTSTINVAIAGRVVPGPAGGPGTVNVPIRVVVTRGEEVLYTQLTPYPVQVGSSAAQFIFNDPNVSFAGAMDKSISIYVGFDEGPPPKKKPAPSQ